MIYVTYPAPDKYRQMSFEEMMAGRIIPLDELKISSKNSTVTRVFEETPDNLKKVTPVKSITLKLRDFNNTYYEILKPQIEQFESLDVRRRMRAENMVYRTFAIPKKKGGLRIINAPNPQLMKALNELKELLQNSMMRTYHTTAFAYIKGRSTIDSIKRHQNWDSRWFAKFDFSDFFGSTKPDWLMNQLSQIWPFNELMTYEYVSLDGTIRIKGKDELRKALTLCFLDGGLPQGTPISPLLTNIMMIPFDHIMSQKLSEVPVHQNGNTDRFVYTRYADDILISCRVDFQVKKVEQFIVEVLRQMNAPFTIKPEKTRYGSRSGQNWNLGVMLNRDNQITVGHQKKRYLKRSINSYILDKKNGNPWPLEDVYVLQGQISYFRMVEGKNIDDIIRSFNAKYSIDVMESIKEDIVSLKE